MAALDTIRPIATTFGLRTLFTSLVAEFATWNDRRVTAKALRQLTDRELNDIGIIRADIDAMTGR